MEYLLTIEIPCLTDRKFRATPFDVKDRYKASLQPTKLAPLRNRNSQRVPSVTDKGFKLIDDRSVARKPEPKRVILSLPQVHGKTACSLERVPPDHNLTWGHIDVRTTSNERNQYLS